MSLIEVRPGARASDEHRLSMWPRTIPAISKFVAWPRLEKPEFR